MKFRLGLLTLTALAPLAAHAQPVDGLYIGAGVGFDYLNALKGKNVVLPVPTGAGIVTASRPVTGAKFNSQGGFVGLGSIGYGLGNGLRIELEGDYRQNHVKVRHSATVNGGGTFQQYGGFLNALYDFDTGFFGFTPYVGVGVGYMENKLQGGRLYSNGNFGLLTNQVGIQFNNSSEGSVAAQGILGASFPLSYALSLTTEVRFMGEFTRDTYKGKATVNGALTTNNNNGNASARLGAPTNESFLVGLRYAFNAVPPAPPPAPAPVAAPAPAPARTYLVFFDWDRADLTERARQIIGEAAANVAKVQVTRIEVNGYTDLSGTAAYNQRLSVRRANAVAAELVKDGVPRSEIDTHGFGESNPLVPTAQGVREPQNRRVEIIFK